MNFAHLVLFEFLPGAGGDNQLIARPVWRRKIKLWSDYDIEDPVPEVMPPEVERDPIELLSAALHEMADEWVVRKKPGDIKSLAVLGRKKPRKLH